MKVSTTVFFGGLALLGALSCISSCAHTDRIVGAWEAAPVPLNVPDAADASAIVTLDFGQITSSSMPAEVQLSATIYVRQAVQGDPLAATRPWEQSVAATASISGSYAYGDGSDDDIIITLDPSSFIVNIDPAGVVFDNNVVTGMESSALDSLTAACADRWRVLLAGPMREVFYSYGRMDDIKIHHNDLMSAGVNHRDCSFRRLGTPGE